MPVPVDEEGMNVAEGIRRYRKARAALVTPSHQFPLGSTLSASRRLQLLEWAQSSGSWILEDDYDSEYRYDSSPIASLQGLDTNSRVLYIGTFSKVLFPSLRLGYVVIPADLVDRFIMIRRAMDLGPPGFHQEVLADFIGEGHFARHIRRMRVLYHERRTALVASIESELGDMVEVQGSEAGMHLTVTLRDEGRDVEIAERAAQQNLSIWPLSAHYLGEAPRRGFILGFGSTPTEEIPRAVRKLRNLLSRKIERLASDDLTASLLGRQSIDPAATAHGQCDKRARPLVWSIWIMRAKRHNDSGRMKDQEPQQEHESDHERAPLV